MTWLKIRLFAPVFRSILAGIFMLFFIGQVSAQEKVTQAKATKQRAASGWPAGLNLRISKLPASPKGSTLIVTFILVSAPKHGKIIMPKPIGKQYYTWGAFATYSSDKGYVGKDSFTWKVNDGNGDSEEVTFSIDVSASLPVPQDQDTLLVENGKDVTLPLKFFGGGGYKSSIKLSKPKHGVLTQEGEKVIYKPNASYVGTDSFTWQIDYTKIGGKKTTSSKVMRAWVVVKKPNMSDWPQWRADEWRSGFTTMVLPSKLHLQWERKISVIENPFVGRGGKYRKGKDKGKLVLYSDIDYCRPVQLGKVLYVPEIANDSIAAFDTDTGKFHWRFFTGGAVRRPPLAFKQTNGKDAVIISSDEGWIYCLNSGDGSVLWKFRAAPNNRKAMGFGRLSSVWPILASPVYKDGKVYFTAGYIPAFALYAYCLDASTGKVEWVNDGRINDIWNTSALGPLALSYDNSKIFGTVEGASRPWVLDSGTGQFLGHIRVGFTFPGSGNKLKVLTPIGNRIGKETKSSAKKGWYVGGKGLFNIGAPVTITVGAKVFTAEVVKSLGVKGRVASLLAGDGKLIVTTAEGGLYCFSGKKISQPIVYSEKKVPLVATNDTWTSNVKTILNNKNIKKGLVYVLGIKNGRLVEELALQSSLMIVAVDTDHKKLQMLRSKMLAADIPASRVSILEGNPHEFQFSPYQAVLICSEDLKFAEQVNAQLLIANLYRATHPFGGEIWFPTSSKQHDLFEEGLKKLKDAQFKISRETPGFEKSEGITRIIRTGLSDENRELKPPFGLILFGSQSGRATSSPASSKWRNQDVYSWLSLPRRRGEKYAFDPVTKSKNSKGYTTILTVSTPKSIFTSMKNPLYNNIEKFVGMPSSGSDSACGRYFNRFGDYGLIHGKISSVYDSSSKYWGRMIFPQIGGCPGRVTAGRGLFSFATTPVPGSTCGCSPAMQVSNFIIATMPYEETWVNFQRHRTSAPIEETAIKKIGINFGAPGDRYISEDELLWTHHPYAGRYGLYSHNPKANPEALPLLQVTYKGKAKSVYHHSAQMHRSKNRYRGWVAASYVKGMTEIKIPLVQNLVAVRTATSPKIDGKLDEEIWKKSDRVVFTPNKVYIDNDRIKLPETKEECYAHIKYDDENLYFGIGTNAEYGPTINRTNIKFIKITLNSRERTEGDIVLTASPVLGPGRGVRPYIVKKSSEGLKPEDWNCQLTLKREEPFSGEFSIPWKKIKDAGLWKEQLIVNIDVSESRLTNKYMPLYFDKAPAASTKTKSHTVRLYFAEMEDKKVGERVFDISLQGKNILSKLDVFKEAGGAKRELMKEFKDVAISNQVQIAFKAVAGEPMLSGIEIIGNYDNKIAKKNSLPTAVIEASALSGAAPFKVTLSARKSIDADGHIVNCAWELGDGRLAKGSELEHTFAEAGSYKVHLLVRDNRGGMATKNININVSPGKPAAFVCRISPKGGDFPTLTAWEKAVQSDLAGDTRKFKVKSLGRKAGKYLPTDNGRKISFKGGATGILKSIIKMVATVTAIKGKPVMGTVFIEGGHKIVISSMEAAAGRSLLFKVKQKGNYNTSDNGKTVIFTGNGTGKLVHINAVGLAYITDCKGTINLGAIKCKSGNSFEVEGSGYPIYSLVAECSGDLSENVKAGSGWICAPNRSVTIRSAKGNYKSFILKGNLDLSALDYVKVINLSIDNASTLLVGKGSSVNRVMAGSIKIAENSMLANSIGGKFSAFNSIGMKNHSFSYYSKDYALVRKGVKLEALAKINNSHISFYNCTAKTFDPGNQSEVEFVNCLVAPGGNGFISKNYSEPASAYNCVSPDDTANVWNKGNGDEKNKVKHKIIFMNANGGDFHLKNSNTSTHSAPGLGADIDGDERKEKKSCVGADEIK